MRTDRVEALSALLAEAEGAHAIYETTELGGVYDEEWPTWYARYAVEHGIDALVGRAITIDELAQFLASSWRELQDDEPKPTEPWSAYTARQIATRL